MFAPPASATTITCNKNGGAPSVGVGGGYVTAYYSHRCNVNPVANGVEAMSEQLLLEFRPVGGPIWTQTEGRYMSIDQAAVDTRFSFEIGSHHGYYRAQMVLVLENWAGQNFSYGSVPGCGRTDVNTVTCMWTGAQKYA